jgi:hypothetical protein
MSICVYGYATQAIRLEVNESSDFNRLPVSLLQLRHINAFGVYPQLQAQKPLRELLDLNLANRIEVGVPNLRRGLGKTSGAVSASTLNTFGWRE